MIRTHNLPAKLLSFVAALVSLAGCTTKTAQTAPMFAVPVTVAKATQKTVPINLTAIGSTEAYSTVSVKARVNAVLEQVHIQEGQNVKKGDLLFTLDEKPFVAALAQAQASLARDQAQAQLSEVEARRYEQLYKAGVSPKERYDQAQSEAEAQRAAVRADQAAVDAAQLQVEYCRVTAPIAGRTGALQVWPGNIVKANDVPILIVINQINPIYVDFSIPEQYLGNVQKFMATGKLRVEAIPYGETAPETGYLTFVDNAVDSTTGTFKLKATFANEKQRLWPGQFSAVSLRLAEDEDAIVVPSQAVQTGRNGDFVYVVKADSTVEDRPVKVARTVDGDSVISSGIQPGETVVTDGQLRLIPGIKVQPAKAAPGS